MGLVLHTYEGYAGSTVHNTGPVCCAPRRLAREGSSTKSSSSSAASFEGKVVKGKTEILKS